MAKIKGIYRIKNVINEKSYIGSSINIKSRIQRHKSELKNNKHSNLKLQRAYIKYGVSSFSYIIEEVFEEITREDLFKKETELIILEDLKNLGYNQMIDSASHFSEINKSKTTINRNKKKFSKKIVAIKIEDGKLYKRFESISEAARELKLESTNISGACKGRLRYLSNYIFKYEENYDENKTYSIRSLKEKSKKHLLSMKKQSQERLGKKTFKYDLNMNFLEEYPSMGEAERENSLNKESLRRKIDLKTPFNGYYWKSNKL